MKYKITNISRHINMLGLYPNDNKIVSDLTDEMKQLYKNNLISIEEMHEEKKNSKKFVEECEVN